MYRDVYRASRDLSLFFLDALSSKELPDRRVISGLSVIQRQLPRNRATTVLPSFDCPNRATLSDAGGSAKTSQLGKESSPKSVLWLSPYYKI